MRDSGGSDADSMNINGLIEKIKTIITSLSDDIQRIIKALLEQIQKLINQLRGIPSRPAKREVKFNITNADELSEFLEKLSRPDFWRDKILTKLEITSIQITDEQLTALAGASGALANLAGLDFFNNKISDPGMASLSDAIARGSLAKLEYLSFNGTAISADGIIAFANAIKPTPENPMGALGRLIILLLTRNSFGDAGLTAFAGAIGTSGAMGKLDVLWLDHNHIGDAGVQALAGAIASGALANLTVLYLQGNQISDPGMKTFSAAIARGALANLTSLRLDGNKISDPGMVSLSDAIASRALAKLKLLYLSYNAIQDLGVQAFASAVASGALASLEELLLDENRIRDAGMNYLADVIKNGMMPNLTQLDLSRNQISDSGMASFKDAFSRHRTNTEERRQATPPVTFTRSDFYTILGVDNKASSEDIRKAYIKNALMWHPDRHSAATDENKKEAEERFKDIAEAYEVLIDTDKRAAYDRYIEHPFAGAGSSGPFGGKSSSPGGMNFTFQSNGGMNAARAAEIFAAFFASGDPFGGGSYDDDVSSLLRGLRGAARYGQASRPTQCRAARCATTRSCHQARRSEQQGEAS